MGDSPYCLSIQPMPVLDATEKTPNMDVIKMIVRVGPLRLAIIYLELQIGRDPCGLDWRQIRAQDNGARMLVGKIDCPDASTSADVEHVRDVVCNWSETELSLEHQCEKMMGDVEVILCLLVIRTPVFAQLHMPTKSRCYYTPILASSNAW